MGGSIRSKLGILFGLCVIFELVFPLWAQGGLMFSLSFWINWREWLLGDARAFSSDSKFGVRLVISIDVSNYLYHKLETKGRLLILSCYELFLWKIRLQCFPPLSNCLVFRHSIQDEQIFLFIFNELSGIFLEQFQKRKSKRSNEGFFLTMRVIHAHWISVTLLVEKSQVDLFLLFKQVALLLAKIN